jgi:membrane protein implicated in regulation of membrane protease activity
MQPEWWHWAVAGIVLILSELAVPAFVLVWFGLGALLVAAMVAVFPAASLAFQIGTWTLASIAMIVVWFKIFKPGSHKTRIGMADANVVGEIGILIHDVGPFSKGKVRFQKPIIGADVWDCMADQPIKSGERVRVIKVEGSLLNVGPATQS